MSCVTWLDHKEFITEGPLTPTKATDGMGSIFRLCAHFIDGWLVFYH